MDRMTVGDTLTNFMVYDSLTLFQLAVPLAGTYHALDRARFLLYDASIRYSDPDVVPPEWPVY